MAKLVLNTEVEDEVETNDYDSDKSAEEKNSYNVKAAGLPETKPEDMAEPSHPGAIYSLISNETVSSGLRKRKNYHQTWKRGDEFDEAIQFGYTQIRKQRKGENLPAGQERGVVLVKREEGGDLVAMEIPEWVYEQHIAVESAKSHRMYNDPDLILSEFQKRTNRDLTSKREEVHAKVIEYEEQEETIHQPKRKAKM
jgi:hypothetical protein